MTITHIPAAAQIPIAQFEVGGTPKASGSLPTPTLATHEAFSAPGDAVSTGVWEATPGTFVRAIMDAEFSHFVAGHATFTTEDGRSFEFRAGDAVYFPPFSRGVWTVHQTTRKTYCIWKS